MEPNKLLICGDLHGNPEALIFAYEEAIDHQVDAIFQVGDYGYWEHIAGGATFLDGNSHLATETGIPLYWIDGNHESHILLRQRYKDSPKTPEGFWTIRPFVYYVPRGTRWSWSGKQLMGLGGAASIDKNRSLARENGTACKEWGIKPGPALGHRTLWWPEEEISEVEMMHALTDKTPLDIMFTHDKPRSSSPRWNRKDHQILLPNQDNIQTVVRALKPKLLIHGHLHFRYEDLIRCGDGESFTRVIGLAHEDGFDGEYVGHGKDRHRGEPSDMLVVLELAPVQVPAQTTN